jgi:hypothetical protein
MIKRKELAMNKKLSLYLLTLLAILLVACSAGADTMESAAPAMDMDVGGGFYESEEAVREPQAFDDSGLDKSATNSTGDGVERLVIKNGDLSIAVDDPIKKMG